MEYNGSPEQVTVRDSQENLFIERRLEVADILRKSFAGAPWFEDIDEAEAVSRVDAHASKPGFEAVLALDQDSVVGGLWYDTPSLEELRSERGEELARFAQFVSVNDDIDRVVWEREVVVSPTHQGMKLATRLRERFLDRLATDGVGSSLLLTRMRDDNGAIISVAKKFDYSRTGIRMPSSQNPEVSHEYWYKVVEGAK